MKKPVLVLGGGIAGVQAACDLAEMNVPVYLVETAPSIGGRMAELDKTFPTGDCSACILAPKLTACASHPLIHLFTLSDLCELRGDAPNFTAVIRKNPRYVDENKCKGCDDCTAVCPVVRQNAFDQNLSTHKAIYKPYAQAVPNKALIEKRGTSSCKFACPAHMDAQGYVTLAKHGRYAEALRVIQRCTPFAGVLGRVCYHPCENACVRGFFDESINLAGIKRFLADHARKEGMGLQVHKSKQTKGRKVAVVGAGPAGLSAAFQLALAGYSVTVFEAEAEAGGMLRYGVPSFRLNKTVLREEIALIESLGVEIKTQFALGRNVTLSELRCKGYAAFFLAVGTQKSRSLELVGETANGVQSALSFLRALQKGEGTFCGKRVLVLGGGNVAMDAARSARRLGAEVTVVYRRGKAQLPAAAEEWELAEEEGVLLREWLVPEKILLDEAEHFCGLQCQVCCAGPRGADGRPVPQPQEERVVLSADTLLYAVGQQVEEDGLPSFLTYYGRQSHAKMPQDIFLGGDMVRGPASVIEAIADGNAAALAIRRFLGEENVPSGEILPETPIESVDFTGVDVHARHRAPTRSAQERLADFSEVTLAADEDALRFESERCLDCSVCSECRLCENTCETGAISHEQTAEIHEVDVGAVVLATGCNTTTEVPKSLGLGRVPGVYTNLAFERLLSASGPLDGHISRIEDGKIPRRIAFLHCVGSRDVQSGAGYCSSVCCMQTVKAASLCVEHLPQLQCADLYYMDMRAYGKDFERFVQNAFSKGPIRPVRSRASACEWDAERGEIILHHCAENGGAQKSRYDMVVLSLGLRPGSDNRELARHFGITTDRFNFFRGQDFPAPKTQRKGFFACGAGAGPKDIPETVTEASATAAGAARFVAHTRGNETQLAQYFLQKPPPEIRDVSKEPVRIGVFVCHCGANIGGVLDVPEITRYAASLPLVAHAEESLYSCSADAQKHISEVVRERALNRVVVASCTPRTHESLFGDVLSQAGLSPSLLTMANIRDQCSWVHQNNAFAATEKAKDLVAMAAARIVPAKALPRQTFAVVNAALVLGGGPAGLAAAVYLTRMGHPVHLVEKEEVYGGNARVLTLSSAGRPLWPHIEEMLSELRGGGLCTFYPASKLQALSGHVGDFNCHLHTPWGEKTLRCGALIVATGGREAVPTEYLYGQHRHILTHRTMEERLFDPEDGLRGVSRVVMIQCVGSRNETRPYCSRLCCSVAVRNAVRIKRYDPNIHVTVLFREMRSYGLAENSYADARALGVEFLRFLDDEPPKVTLDGSRIVVRVHDPLLREERSYHPDILSLAAAVEANREENHELSQILKVPLGEDGFFLEAHAKLRPVDFATEGIFLAGLAHSPRDIRESVTQARAAAARAATVLAKECLETGGEAAVVDESRCIACGACAAVCPYGAVSITGNSASVSTILCKACGSCVAACRPAAMELLGCTNNQMMRELNALLSRK